MFVRMKAGKMPPETDPEVYVGMGRRPASNSGRQQVVIRLNPKMLALYHLTKGSQIGLKMGTGEDRGWVRIVVNGMDDYTIHMKHGTDSGYVRFSAGRIHSDIPPWYTVPMERVMHRRTLGHIDVRLPFELTKHGIDKLKANMLAEVMDGR